MRIMVAILVLAFVALAWAIERMARHIRHVRAQRRLATEAQHPQEITGAAETQRAAPSLGSSRTPAPPPPPPPPAQSRAEESSAAAVPRFPLSSHRVRAASAIAESMTAVEEAVASPLRRSPSSAPPARPYASYFKEDFGDLSDPEPQRFRERRQR